MCSLVIKIVTFDNEFDLTKQDLSLLTIKENSAKDNCIIWDSNDQNKVYTSFIISKNTKSKTICVITFYKSSSTKRYIPRLTFKRLKLTGEEQTARENKTINISFNTSEDALIFWKLIGFLNSYKELVDLGEFDKSFKVVSKDSYIIEFRDKETHDKIKDIKELISISNLTSNDIKSITFENRKKDIKVFFYLLKNLDSIHERYKIKYNIKNLGEEFIWHHFLKNHDWILGLNADLKFVMDFYHEQNIGMGDSKGAKSPKADFVGISEYTVLVELKHSNTRIFKEAKSKGRANTWDFTSDFIEGISQCLGQKFDLDKYFDEKIYIKDEHRLDKRGIESIDPKTIFLIGNKKEEFPINELNDNNLLKNKTLERFRRNIRNIDILTFDELFERAYHIVFSKKLDKNWYTKNEAGIFN
jgi:hypothetical protein